MCGIAGQVRNDGRPVDRSLLDGMCAAIEHRGPDARGIFQEDGTGLGIARLRVIDLHTGDQPIFNEHRSVVVVLNGEIYNFRELRERLQAGGHVFATGSDTEVIVHLYEEEGPACVRSLHGMFAFALWDGRRRQLLLARDRVGKKPLFYAHRDGVLSFASELNALLVDPEIPRSVDHTALDSYLAYGWVPGPRSGFQAVRKLPPASTLLLRDGRATVDRYWRLDYSRKRDIGSRAELGELVREAIRTAVRRRMVADVPLGAFLSGGIDSSAVVAAMAEASSEPVKTFSIGFDSHRFDELAAAKALARRFATDHHELVVKPDAEMIPALVRAYGEPFGEPSALPAFHLARMAARHVTVALTGDGGDESFAGYPRYPVNVLLARAGVVPRRLRSAVTGLAGRLAPGRQVESWASRIRRASRTLALDPDRRYLAYVTSLNGLDCDRLYTPAYRELVGTSESAEVTLGPWSQSSAAELIDLMLDVDVQTYLPDNHLVKMDIATMAHSLEARSPLLDHELMELAASIPAPMKVRGLQKKVALRDALRGWLPDEVLDRPKQGFELPVGDWFRGQLASWLREVLLDRESIGRGHFEEAYVRTLLDQHTAGTQDHGRPLWTLLMLELWYREVVETTRPEVSAAT